MVMHAPGGPVHYGIMFLTNCAGGELGTYAVEVVAGALAVELASAKSDVAGLAAELGHGKKSEHPVAYMQ